MSLDKITLTRTGVTALIITMIFITGITIVADLVIPVKTWLAATYGHHWVGKGIWAVILFVFFTFVSYPLFKRNTCDLSPRLVMAAANLAIVGAVVMTLFFVYEYLWK